MAEGFKVFSVGERKAHTLPYLYGCQQIREHQTASWSKMTRKISKRSAYIWLDNNWSFLFFKESQQQRQLTLLPNEVADDTVTLKWSEPQNNGKEITQYTVYQRVVTDGKPGGWIRLKIIANASVRKFTVDLTKGKVYEFCGYCNERFWWKFKRARKFREGHGLRGPFGCGIEQHTPWSNRQYNHTKVECAWKLWKNNWTIHGVDERMVVDGKPGEWIKLKTITEVTVRELTVELEKGKEYEFVVTATNVHGEK